MMLLLGLLIIIGTVLDIILKGWTGLHIIPAGCGLLLILINFAGEKLSFGKSGAVKAMGKNILSFAVIILAAMFLFGFFSSEEIPSAEKDLRSILLGADKISKNEGAQKALSFLEKATEGMEWDMNAAFMKGRLLAEAGQIEKAKSKFSEIIYYMPFDAEARCELAAIEIRLKNHRNAIDQLMHVVKSDPSYARAHMLLGDAYFGMGDAIRGIFYYKIAADEDPSSLEKRMRLACAFAKTHSWKEAGEEFKKALELASNPEEELTVYKEYRSINTGNE